MDEKKEERKTQVKTYIDRAIENIKSNFPEKYANAKAYGEVLMDRMEINGILGPEVKTQKEIIARREKIHALHKEILYFGDLFDPSDDELVLLKEEFGEEWREKLPYSQV